MTGGNETCSSNGLFSIFRSIGDTFHSRTNAKDAFLPDLTTRSLAEQTNTYLQHAVRRDGEAYVPHLDGFIVALREELDSPGGMNARNPPAVERKPYRMDVTPDGTGIESPGWFRASLDEKGDESIMMSRLCALEWVVVLYESVVPDALKAEVCDANRLLLSSLRLALNLLLVALHSTVVCTRIHYFHYSSTCG